MAFVIDRSLYLSPEVVVEPRRSAPLEVKEDPFSLEALVAWLEKRDPNETYNWENCSGRCLLAQYQYHCLGKRVGSTRPSGYSTYFGAELTEIFEDVAYPQPWTFGAAKDRARKLLAEREK